MHNNALIGNARRFRALATSFAMFCIVIGSHLAEAQAWLPNQWSFSPIVNVSSVAYSPDETLLAVGGDNGLCLYSASTRLPFRGLPTGVANVNSVAFSPDGHTLAIGGRSYNGGSVLELWNYRSGHLVASLASNAVLVNSVAFSSNGLILAVGGAAGDLNANSLTGVAEEWNVSTEVRSVSLATTASIVDSVAFSPDGKKLAVGGTSASIGVLEVWNAPAGSLFENIGVGQATTVNSVAFSPDGNSLAGGGSGPSGSMLQMWTVASGAVLDVLNSGIKSVVSSVAFSPDGRRLVVAGANQSPYEGSYLSSGAVELWDLTNGPSVIPLETVGWTVNSVEFSPDGVSLEVAGSNYGYYGGAYGSYEPMTGFFDIWRVSDASLQSSNITGKGYLWGPVSGGSPTFSPGGMLVAGGGIDQVGTSTGVLKKYFNVWNADTGTLAAALPTSVGSTSFANSFSPDGHALAIAGVNGTDGVIDLWNVPSYSLALTLKTGVVSEGLIAFSPDGKRLAIGGFDASGACTIEIWDPATGVQVKKLAPAISVGFAGIQFSADGRSLADGGSLEPDVVGQLPHGVVELWDVASGNLLANLATGESYVHGIAFSPDGKQIAVAGQEAYSAGSLSSAGLEVWSVASKQRLSNLPLQSGTNAAFSVTYAPDGKMLFVSSSGGPGEIQVFDAAQFKVLGYYSVGAYGYFALSQDGKSVVYSKPDAGLEVAQLPPLTSDVLTGFMLNPAWVQQGKSTTCTVTLSKAAPSGGVTVGLESGFQLTLPSTIIVPSGKKSVSFTVRTPWEYTPTVIPITASVGPSSKVAKLTILTPSIKAVSLNAASVLGGQSLKGTVAIVAPAGPVGSAITLVGGSSFISVPADVFLLSGETYATFEMTSKPVDARMKVTVTASDGITTKSTQITLMPPSLRSVTVSPTTVKGGSKATGIVALNGPAGPSGVVVVLSSNKNSATAPRTVKIAAGSSSATFSIDTKSVSSTTVVTIAATAGGMTQSTGLTIT
ncbi:MAG: hypothetical protein P4L46_00185 [Fimbriimonas sp.]|nr:hypothetical protein [Fimbriimonas sp.]